MRGIHGEPLQKLYRKENEDGEGYCHGEGQLMAFCQGRMVFRPIEASRAVSEIGKVV